MSYKRRDLLAATGGAALVGVTHATEATGQTGAAPLRRMVVYAADWGVLADAKSDDTVRVQAVIDAHPGEDIVFDGTMALTDTIVVRGDKTKLVFRNGAGFTFPVATMTGMVVSGDDVTLEGVHFLAPAVFDGTNAQPRYSVILVTGDNCRILGGKITNVPKVGVIFSECEGGLVSQLRIDGNFPPARFTGTEVAHAGVVIDAAQGGRQGNFLIQGNDIAECVQGILIANYGPASRSQGIIVSGNNFHRCWNHGVYGAGINYANSVVGNVFINCQVPIALSGYYHVVTGNTITTGDSSHTSADEVGISLRDPVHCIVANNVVQGETGSNQAVINLLTSLGKQVRGNIVSGNTLEISGTGSANLIRLGGMDCTELTDNQVSSNTCIGIGRNQSGIIQLVGAAGCAAYGTIVSANSLVVRSASHGVQLLNATGASVVQNTIRLEYAGDRAVRLAGIAFSACSDCDFVHNSIHVPSSSSKNVVPVGLWESGRSGGNRAAGNAFRVAAERASSAAHYLIEDKSGIVVDDTGQGAPAFNAGVGSTWRRTDGAPGATFYVKESGMGGAGWASK